MTKAGPKLKDKPQSKHKDASSVPYGPPQPEPDPTPAARRSAGSAGRTVLKVGATIAAPFILRAIFKAVTK